MAMLNPFGVGGMPEIGFGTKTVTNYERKTTIGEGTYG